MFENRFLHGFSVGVVLPFLAGFILIYLDSALMDSTLMSAGNMKFLGFKKSTLGIIAICSNLLPTLLANRRLMDEFIRGIMFPTVLFSLYWFYTFYDKIM